MHDFKNAVNVNVALDFTATAVAGFSASHGHNDINWSRCHLTYVLTCWQRTVTPRDRPDADSAAEYETGAAFCVLNIYQ